MKQFRRTEEGYYICEECGKIVKNASSFGKHILTHMAQDEYIIKWLKEDGDGICKECGEKTRLVGAKYNIFCSNKCANSYNNLRYLNTPERREKTKKKLLENFGVENVFQLEEVKNKCKEQHVKNLGVDHPSKSPKIKKQKELTCLKNHGVKAGFADEEKRKKTKKERYGDENYNNRKKEKQTKKERYGDENYHNVEKMKQTKKERYGDENFNNREQARKTCVELYGVENNMQDKDLFEKNCKAALKLKPYLNTDLYYQGTFELDFLENHHKRFKDVISRAPSIKYTFNNVQHVHHPDFYIKTLNLIIECKNSYLYKRDKDVILAKKNAAIARGYNYIIIIDKDYTEFNKIIERVNVSPSTL